MSVEVEQPKEPGAGSFTDADAAKRRIVVVGGGIAGLTAAYDLQEAYYKGDSDETESESPEIVLLEQDTRLGGKVWTERIEEFLVEAGPDSFVTNKPDVLDLTERLGLTEQLLAQNSAHAGSRVWWRGRLHPLPEGLVLMVPSRLGPLLNSSLLSPLGKARLFLDLFIRPRAWREYDDESLESFVTRRLGHEVLERIAEPLVAGIHSAEPASMSLQASFPRFIEMEKQHGSLIRAALAARKQAQSRQKGPSRSGSDHDPQQSPPRSYFMSFREGMGSLITALKAQLNRVLIQTESRLEGIIPDGGRYKLFLAGQQAPLVADAVIFALPAHASAQLLAKVAPGASAALEGIGAVSTAIVHLAYRQQDVSDLPQALAGSGFVVPAKEKRRIRGVTFVSQKWQGRAPNDTLLLRAFVGGRWGRELAEGAEAPLVQAVQEELSSMLGIRAQPTFVRAHAWRQGMHAYTLGHLQRVADAEASVAQVPGLFLAGGAYEGIGLNDCIRTGQRAAADAIAHLRAGTSRPHE